MEGAAETERLVRRGLHSSLISIGSNFSLAVLKCLAGFLGHSFALVADGIESLSDVFSSTVVYFGLRVAIKPPDKDHPYGHGKAEPVAAAAVALAMGAAAIGIAIESIVLIRTPHPLPMSYTLVVLLCVFGIKLLLTRYVSSVAHNIDSTAVRGDAWHHFSDAITSLFAFVGISVALATKDFRADDWAALCASAVILFNAARMIRTPMDEILDTAPPPDIEEHVREVAASVPGVVGLEKCFVRKVGFRYYVDLHVVVNGDLTVRSGHVISHKVEDCVLAEVSRVAKVLVHIEPEEELFNPSHSDM
ncbi:MAG TPA: cation diffusion facilitator family transporter [Acidobacteriaceae bacterium]|jgi:cation diffusion facilitator family transporter|nr:cation diffusion facilitator family transporter [Acidobacteriaceae bacterium]